MGSCDKHNNKYQLHDDGMKTKRHVLKSQNYYIKLLILVTHISHTCTANNIISMKFMVLGSVCQNAQ